MSQVERLIGVGRGVLHHIERSIVGDRREAESGLGIYLFEQPEPCIRGNFEVQKSFDHVESGDDSCICCQPGADLLCCLFRFFPGDFQ
ncbi:hypothetical protein SDC9_208490 [bioreactor metagenome]|uniref:Uncharacterized protein n=1 Tax=bioreactor metagenome TaxID=1076179 RepID=A0A645JAS3_9ZZZZ